MLASNASARSRVPSALPDHTLEFIVTINQLSSAAWPDTQWTDASLQRVRYFIHLSIYLQAVRRLY